MTTTSTGAPRAHPSAPPFAEIPPAAISRILSRFEREQLAGFIAVAIDLMDFTDGDPDHEDATDLEDDFALSPQALAYTDGPGCEASDTGEQAYVEWTTMRGSQKGSPNSATKHEDDEEDDPSGQCDEDGINTDFALAISSQPGCNISDPDYAADDVPCDEPYQDEEREQMVGDVPMLPVFSYEHNVFSDARVSLGISNLQSSFRTNGGEVMSADSGNLLTTRHDGRTPEGVPV